MPTTSTTAQRGQYGELVDTATVREGRAVLDLAISQGKLPAAYFERHSSKRATALNYDIYDRLGGQWLIQQRETEMDKYGSHPTKYYYLIRRVGRGIEVTEVVNKAKANRAAKTATKLGDAIRCLRGERKIPSAKRGPVEVEESFKAVAIVQGEYRSIFDSNTVYNLGRAMVERAEENHGGGYYVYATASEAAAADVPNNSDNLSAPRVILRCECSGRRIQYGSGKMAYTRIKPVEVVSL
jgi:hypothetical protein